MSNSRYFTRGPELMATAATPTYNARTPIPRMSAAMLTPFGVELRKLRIENRKRIFDLATDLGVSSASVSAWETGRRDVQNKQVERIGELFKLTQPELAKLKEVADISRSRVVIEAQSSDARLLANSIKQKINSMSPEIIREILARYFPSSTQRYDQAVRPRTVEEIAKLAQNLRCGLGYNDFRAFDIVGFYELNLAKIFAEILGTPNIENNRFEIWEDWEMPAGTVGMSSMHPPHIILSDAIYRDAANNGHRGRWIMSHELGHLWLLHGIDDPKSKNNTRGPEYLAELLDGKGVPDGILSAEPIADDENARRLLPFEAPQSLKKIPFRQSAEAQADEFAAELLMPRAGCIGLQPHNISLRFGVSIRNATSRLKMLRKRTQNLH